MISEFFKNNWVALLLFVLSICISYLISRYFWKNPCIQETPRLYNDKENKITYAVRNNNGKWNIKRIDDNATDIDGAKIVTIATKSNNPQIKFPPDTIENLRKLNFE